MIAKHVRYILRNRKLFVFKCLDYNNAHLLETIAPRVRTAGAMGVHAMQSLMKPRLTAVKALVKLSIYLFYDLKGFIFCVNGLFHFHVASAVPGKLSLLYCWYICCSKAASCEASASKTILSLTSWLH